MANILLVLLGLGLIPISAALLDNAKGPDARLGLAFFTVWVLFPWWIGAGVLTGMAWFRGALSGLRWWMVVGGFGLMVVAFLMRTPHMGLPGLLDKWTCLLMPAGLVVVLGWLMVVGAERAPVFVALVALVSIGVPVVATTGAAGYQVIQAREEILAEWKASREKARAERLRQEEEANTELRELRGRLAGLPVDCDIEALVDLYTGPRPENFRAEVLRRILERPTIEADLAKMLASAGGGYSLAPYLIANDVPKVTAGLAPAMNLYMERIAATFPQYKGAYPEVFGREVNGLHTILTGARRVQEAGGDLTAGLDAFERGLGELPEWASRKQLEAAVRNLRGKKR
ncbi:MAG: hypothetical protein U0R19_18965 [Bryobacteraceae bacterium]